MRRSFAPSQSLVTPNGPQYECDNTCNNSTQLFVTPAAASRLDDGDFSYNLSPNNQEASNALPTMNTKIAPTFGKKTSFQSPLTSGVGSRPHVPYGRPSYTSPQPTSPVTCNTTATDISDGPETHYFSVMWCKASMKKHKKWEGDAVLVTRGRCVTLYDMEGKEIGKSSGFKITTLSSLKEDETLFVGGKEIQVMSAISEVNFKTGKCFMAESNTAVSEEPVRKAQKVAAKPFVQPMLNPPAANLVGAQSVIYTCNFDPTAPGALVMPRPTQAHQWQYNKKALPVNDVIVDPYLALKLRPHQREGVTFLYECLMGYRDYAGTGAILADDMGLGKTLQTISVIWTMLKQGPYGGKSIVKKILIITPGSLVKNWSVEFRKWLGTERISVFAVSQDNKTEEFLKSPIHPVLIISYEMFIRCTDMLSAVNFDLVVCDEGHRLKNTAIKTTSIIMNIPTRKRVVLSGTPIQNDLHEFYSIVEFVNPGMLVSSASFRRLFEDPIVAARQPDATPPEVDLGETRASELTRLTKLFVLRRTQDINNKYLPPKLDLVLFCPLSSQQHSLYTRLLSSRQVRSCLAGVTDGTYHLTCIAALKKLCNHPALIYKNALDLSSEFMEEDKENSIYHNLLELYPNNYNADTCDTHSSGKLQVLVSLLRNIYTSQLRERVVLISNHTKTLDMLQHLCDDEGYKWLRLDGQTPTGQRQGLVQRFNSPHGPEFVFLLSSKAGGVGLNLIGASRVVLYDIDWNPANDLQAMARVWRDGQTKKVYTYRLISTGTIEEKIYQRQISKQGLSGAVMDIKDKKSAQFSKDDLRDLFGLNEGTLCDTHDLLGCQCYGDGDKLSSPVTVAPSRTCQLGATSTSILSQRNLTMDELLDLHHIEVSEDDHFPPEWHLCGAKQAISYLFWSESKGQ